ncbi:MAG TPA: phage major capsid protein, partial [Candidatus Paceibacterota bacterium]
MATLDTVVNAMLTRSRAKLIMASAISGTVSAYLHAKKRVVVEDGGPSITNPLITGLNPNVQSMQYYDTVSVDQTNEFSTVSYNMSRVVGSLIISDQEEDENQGRAAIFKILTGKIKALDESISRQFATYHTSVGTGSDPNGLGNLIPADPTTGSVGGINLANEGQWRSSSYNFAGSLTPENIEEAFDDIIELDLNRGSDGQKAPKPSVIFAGRNIYRMHKAAARDKQQIKLSETGTGKKLVNLGIVGTTHNGIPVLFDEKLSANVCYFVNEEYLTLHVLRGVNMKIKKLTAP